MTSWKVISQAVTQRDARTKEYPGRSLAAQIWRAEVGRIPLYLLDTNIAANQTVEDRDITDQLYGGDREMRIKQEIMLGIPFIT